jgi:hypothetical protein
LGPDYFWYLSVGWATKDCSRHHGHPALNPKNANTGSTKLCEDDLLLTQQMRSAGCDYSAVAQTISEHTGNLFDSQQMPYLTEKKADLLSGLSADANLLTGNITMYTKIHLTDGDEDKYLPIRNCIDEKNLTDNTFSVFTMHSHSTLSDSLHQRYWKEKLKLPICGCVPGYLIWRLLQSLKILNLCSLSGLTLMKWRTQLEKTCTQS